MDNKGKMNVGPGDMAPLFKCTSVTSKHEENKEFSLEDYINKGKYVVLFFYRKQRCIFLEVVCYSLIGEKD